jgi:hypothetical protein
MFETNLKIIDELKQFLYFVKDNPEVLSKFSNSSNAFIRDRKLPFDRTALLIAKCCKKTLGIEIENFFEELNIDATCTASAYTQQRMKLNAQFFYSWNQILSMSYYHHCKEIKCWKGYRLVGLDGSNISLVKTPALQSYFGGQSNQLGSFVQGKTFYCFDILNELVLHAQLAPYRKGEIPMAYESVSILENDMIAIYDRNFSIYKLMAMHIWRENEIKFLIRAKDSLRYVRSFIQSGKQSEIISLLPTPSAIATLKKDGYRIDKNTELKLRLVRVELEETIEVLITNLWEEDGFENEEFKELYFKRWGIETNIGFQKNILQLESFSGLTPLSVEQDFHATVFMANLHSILIKDAQQTINENGHSCKYARKVNKNKSIGRLKKYIVQVFHSDEPKVILEKLYNYFIRDTIPIRVGRSFPRIVRNKQSKSKHKTYTNYKPAY